MTVREQLIEILRKPIFPHELADPTEAVADYLLDNGVTVQRWIPVTERLPEDDQPLGALCEVVQVLLQDNRATVGWCNRGLKCWYYLPIHHTKFVGHGYDLTPVIAWRPLPDAPKGVG